MADVPTLEKEALDRLQRARKTKALIAPDLREGLFFTNPRLSLNVYSGTVVTQSSVAATGPQAQSELQTTLGTECAQEFSANVIKTFMPQRFPWCRRGRGLMDEDKWETIKDDVEVADETVLQAIRSSNFEAVAHQAYDPNLSIGMTAMWIEEDDIWKAPNCRAIPLRKLEIDLGPGGEIDGRFYVDWIPGRDVRASLSKYVVADLPAETAKKLDAQPDKVFECTWGLWRNWEKRGTETWVYVILIDKKLVHEEELEGEGSCPLVVTPWAPNADTAWGDGPALKALPYLRVIDGKSAAIQDIDDIAVSKPFSYPHDGVINFEGGIEANKAYPHAMGTTKEEFVDLSFGAGQHTQEGMLVLDMVERSVKRIWFNDGPEQRGKTPPTKTQWLDELVDQQQRIGLVGQRYWRDGPRAYFLRFKHILERRGVVKEYNFPLEPYNPALKAQEYQEVQLAAQLLQMVLAFGGVQGQVLVDVNKTFENIKDKLGDKIVVFNTPEKLQALLQQVLPQAQVNVNNPRNIAAQPQGAY